MEQEELDELRAACVRDRRPHDPSWGSDMILELLDYIEDLKKSPDRPGKKAGWA